MGHSSSAASANASIARGRPTGSDVDLLRLHAALPARYPFLLESVAEGAALSQYDILFAFPGEQWILQAPGRLTGPAFLNGERRFLDGLDAWFRREGRFADTAVPFVGGWFLYLGYELAQEIEPRLRLPMPNIPLAVATRIPAAIIRERRSGAIQFVAEPGNEALRAQMAEDLRRAQDHELGAFPSAGAVFEDSPEQFLNAVARAKEYIVAGDVFQVNLSREWRGEFRADVSAAMIYERLRAANPAPFAGSACFGDWSILSSSPERLISVYGREVQTRPIAGTKPRAAAADADIQQWQELLRHPKERAEHIMLIDLERNDLGRICESGSVEVNELMVVESYRHVHHIVSNVRGRLRADATPGQVIRAVFPGGTITGCPKVRCMEIIAELEHGPRGPYTGSFGYLGRDGRMDLNILIRSVWLQGRQWRVRAGAGIVADSVPASELDETRAKARGVLAALGADRG